MHALFRRCRLFGALLLLCFSVACSRKETTSQAPAPGPAPVETALVERKSIPVEVLAVGAVEPLSRVELRPKVGGEVIEALFHEGAFVAKGDKLFEIDPRPYEAALRGAKASAETARIQAKNAREQADRYESLIKRGAASEEQSALIISTSNAAQATLEAREAEVDAAALSLEWTSVLAPISGRIGRALVKPGNIVQPNDEILAVINQIQPIAVAFAVPERILPDIRARSKQATLKVRATPMTGNGNTAEGALVFIDNTVDVTSGMVALKAEFKNSDESLWPGQFVDVVLLLEEDPDALLIPTTAILEGAVGAQVFVVREAKAELRPVKVERTYAEFSIISSGLEPGEEVITSGQLRVKQGSKVEVKNKKPQP